MCPSECHIFRPQGETRPQEEAMMMGLVLLLTSMTVIRVEAEKFHFRFPSHSPGSFILGTAKTHRMGR